MRKHSDHDVASLAKDVYMQWRTFIKNHSNRPSIEVRSDPKTEAFRKNARKLLCEALDLEVALIFGSKGRNKLDKPFSVIVSIKLVLLAEWGQEFLYSVILPMSPFISIFVLKVDFLNYHY